MIDKMQLVSSMLTLRFSLNDDASINNIADQISNSDFGVVNNTTRTRITEDSPSSLVITLVYPDFLLSAS